MSDDTIASAVPETPSDEEIRKLVTAKPDQFPVLADEFVLRHPNWIKVTVDGDIIGVAASEEEAQKMRERVYQG